MITAGDLVICNFNDGATNAQGLGTTIVGLHPTAGAKAYHIAQSPALQGCNALTMLPDDSISAAAYTANKNSLVTPNGVVDSPFAADTFHEPWGEAYATAHGQNAAALYISNVDSGSIDRISLTGDNQSTFTEIVTGFCNSGTPGAIAAPPTPATTFNGPSASSARVIAHGGPFIAPISDALLSNGDLIVGNGDINITAGQMSNLAVEISPVLPGGFVGQPVQLDTSGTPGALFGIAATVDGQGNQVVYFNDDNTSKVMMVAAPVP